MPSRRVIGLDAGGTKLLAGVVDQRLEVHHRLTHLWEGRGRDEVLDTFVATAEDARNAAPGVEAVGFGIPSLVDHSSGVSLTSVHLPLEGVPFRELMSERLGLPVFVDNDSNTAVLAEHRFGAARGASNVVMLTLGTGIGGGLVLDGELYRGSIGAAGELGHMVVDMDGPPCGPGCPGRGCLEAVASGTAIGREGTEAARERPDSALGRAARAGEEITGALVTQHALAGDDAACDVMRLVGRRLGVGIAALVNIFNPEVVVVGGGAMAAGELLLGPAREVAGGRALPGAWGSVRVVPAAFTDEAGMLGAAVMALEGMEKRP